VAKAVSYNSNLQLAKYPPETLYVYIYIYIHSIQTGLAEDHQIRVKFLLTSSSEKASPESMAVK